MTKINDGGQAFPNVVQRWNDRLENQEGMTLRDWFAGQALDWATMSSWSSHDEKHIAERAYKLADAMLAAREVAK